MVSIVRLNRWRRDILGNNQSATRMSEICESYLKAEPSDVEILKAYIEHSIASRNVAVLSRLLSKIISLSPEDQSVYALLVTACSLTGNLNLIRRHKNKILELRGDFRLIETIYHLFYKILDFDSAERFSNQLAGLAVASADQKTMAQQAVAQTHMALGDFKSAELIYRKLISAPIETRQQKVYWSLATLRKYNTDDNHIDHLKKLHKEQGLMGRQLDPNSYYALGKELEDCQRYDEAFHYYQLGAEIVREKTPYRLADDVAAQDMFKRLYSKMAFASVKPCRKPKPIFILGMPRTGSTLLERILTSHSSVTTIGETAGLRSSFNRQLGGVNPLSDEFDRWVESGRPFDYAQLQKTYYELVVPEEVEAEFFVDKMPLNIAYAGVILRAFPDAKIIYTDRNPMDSCFSNFKQIFNDGFYPYSYDLVETGEHYLLVKEFSEYWRSMEPDRVFISNYDTLVSDPKGSISHVLDFCDLSAEEACYSPEKNEAGVATASLSQVRSKIYQSSKQKWCHFEKQLQPLVDFFRSRGVDL